MTDNKSSRAPEDNRRINIAERCEVIYWTNKFAVSESQLEDAVMRVGSAAEAVEEHLMKK